MYGKRNRTPTPVKEVICYDYANKGEEQIKSNYQKFIAHSQNKVKLKPIITKKFEEKIKTSQNQRNMVEQPKKLFKMKLFSDVESKVKRKIEDSKNKSKLSKVNLNDENIDCLIEKVEKEIKEL